MVMTPEEIAREYRLAKRPQNQIQILADENCCTRDEIKRVLLAQGCDLPKNMMPKQRTITLTHDEAVALCEHIEQTAQTISGLEHMIHLVHVYEKCKKEAEG